MERTSWRRRARAFVPALLLLFALAGWMLPAAPGPAAEADDPYGDHVSPEGISPVCHVQTVKLLGEKDYDAIKRAVYETGGVQSSLYLPEQGERDRSA